MVVATVAVAVAVVVSVPSSDSYIFSMCNRNKIDFIRTWKIFFTNKIESMKIADNLITIEFVCTFIVDFNRTWDFCQIFSMKLFSICFPVSWLSKYKWFFFTPIFVKISNLDYAVNWKVFPQTQRHCTRNVEIPWNERDWNQSVLVAFNIDLISKNQPKFSVYQQSAIFF